MKAPRAADRGLMLIDAVMGVALLGVLSLVLALVFRAGMVSANRSAATMSLLAAARKSLAGEGSLSGMVGDIQRSGLVAAVSSGSLTMQDAVGNPVVYELSASGALLQTKGTATVVLSQGLSRLQFSYFARNPDYTVTATTSSASADLVGVYFKASSPGRTASYFSGAALKNHL